MASERALVLGGGGIAGIAWELGVLSGLAEAQLDVTGADLIVGTSAGSTVAAQITSDRPLDWWFRQQADPAFQNEELRPTGLSVEELWEKMLAIAEETSDPGEQRRRVAAMALDADTVAEPVRRAIVAGRFAGDAWPTRRVSLVAVESASGDRVVFDARSGVSLVDAVAASCAVPGVWPPVTIGGRRYVDGGVFSLANADLAAGSDRVLVVAPMADPQLDDQLELLGGAGRAELVTPDRPSLAAFGADPLDPAVRAPCAQAGIRQGRQVAGTLAGWWEGTGADG
jgi:NTE family protein